MSCYLTEMEESSHLICLTSPCAFVIPFVECGAEFLPLLTLERPGGSDCGPREGCFGNLPPGGVSEKDVDLQCPKTGRAWERRKLKMEKALRWTWERNEKKKKRGKSFERIDTARILGNLCGR